MESSAIDLALQTRALRAEAAGARYIAGATQSMHPAAVSYNRVAARRAGKRGKLDLVAARRAIAEVPGLRDGLR